MLKLALTGDYLRYVKPIQQPWIIAAGAVMVLLGWALARALELNVDIVGAPLEWIRRQPELAGFKAPFTGERFILDITKVKEGLGYRPTPLATWLRTTASWFLRDYEGPAAGGYTDRTSEIAAAKRWLALTQGRLDAL
jgi:hypothetical protein